MKSLLLSPHDDDSVLFAAFTCMREKPHIMVCLDSYLQPARGEIGCDDIARRAESDKAHTLLGCLTLRLGLRDDNVTEQQVIDAFAALTFLSSYDVVYAPEIQGGNQQHDMIARAADRFFGKKVIHYTTYSKNNLYTVGSFQICGTSEEHVLKREALYCFESQLRVNMPHFKAVLGNSEWLMEPPVSGESHSILVDDVQEATAFTEHEQAPEVNNHGHVNYHGHVNDRGPVKVHLGCGSNILPGYINIDRMNIPGVAYSVDLCDGIPLADNSADYVISQDFLEHLPPEKKVFIINEIWRVLKPGGVMEHNVPNAFSMNDSGSPTHISHWSLQQFEHWDVDSYRHKKDKMFEGITGGFKKQVAELVNFKKEDDGVNRAQSIHVRYQKVENA